MADGPIQFNGAYDSEQLKIQTLSKFGRSFSIVRVPYAFKLLMQELLTMNVQMRIITEANIDQLTNLSFSDNIQQLAGKQINLKDLQTKGLGLGLGVGQTNKEKKSLAAIGFTKLLPPPFKKWLIKAIDPVLTSDLTPLPSADYNEFITLEPAQENAWFKLNDEIVAAKSKLDEIPFNIYSVLSRELDMYARLRSIVVKTYNMENATNAGLKMYELIYQMDLLTKGATVDGNCLPAVQAFCNAELPGAFIIAINHFMKTRCVGSSFDWIASSYLPAAAMQAGNTTILDDKFKIYERNRLHWLMGPAPNGLPDGEVPVTGDVTDPAVINTLGNAAHQRFNDNDGANLYTSDVGKDVKDPNKAEEETADINMGQVLTGLLSLAIGGHFVTKQFTFVTPFSRSLIAIVASLFEETYITKPKTSRPLNSEIYLVGKGFRGISPELAKALLDRCEAYKTLDKWPTTWGSLLQPAVLAKVDADILLAAQEVHGEQQVAFLEEIATAYRVSGGERGKINNPYEAKAQKDWLNENPLAVIASDENLNNAVIEEAAQYMPPQRQQTQQRTMQMSGGSMHETMQQPELIEESILIPEEERPAEAEQDSEAETEVGGSGGGSGGSGGDSKKKTIKFDFAK